MIIIAYIKNKFTCSNILLLLLLPCLAFAQPKKGFEPEDAEEHFKHTNYLMALKVYKELIKSEPKNMEYQYKAGLCYLFTNINRSLAIPYLEKVTQQEKFSNEALFHLGKAYHYAMRFDDAIAAYTKYKENAKGSDIEKADRNIEMCNNGKELVKYPANITFENAGREINSEYPDYYPLVDKDESLLVFTTRRKENVGARLEFDGYYPSDIYSATVKNGKWEKAKDIGRMVNTVYDEQAVGMSSDGKNIVVYIDHIDSLGNIYQTENIKGSYKKIKKLDENVNKGFERSGSFAPNGEIIFFASDRKDGMGETDLYMCRKLPTGKWGLPQSLGPNINTKYKEDFPFLAEDGKTLFFASEGHSSMGEFDLFKAVWNEEENTWSKPVNLGYPINTPQENRSISFTSNDRVAYISALREGGYGDLDIYRITFNEAEQRYGIVSGNIITSDSLQKDFNAEIIVTDLSTKIETPYKAAKSTGKYVMALKPGKYAITVEMKGYKTYVDAVIIYDMGSFQPETIKDFKLEKEQ